MVVNYKGFEIEVKREKCMAGYPLLYFNVFRDSDGWQFVGGFEDSAETVKDKIKQMKHRVDMYLLNPEDCADKEGI